MPSWYPLPPRRTIVEVEVPVGDGDIDVLWEDSVDVSDALAGTLGPVQTPDTFDVGTALVLDDLYQADSIDVFDSMFFDVNEALAVEDSFDVSDQLAGTLGPVQTPDTLDFSDEFIGDDLYMQDSVDASDELQEVYGPFVSDSVDMSAALSGTLGPIRAPDTLDFGDELVADLLEFYDTVDVSDFLDTLDLFAAPVDSVDISDRFGPIQQFDDDSLKMADQFPDIHMLDSGESFDVSDEFGDISGLTQGDSAAFGDLQKPVIIAPDAPDSLGVGDGNFTTVVESPDSMAIDGRRKPDSEFDGDIWPDTVVTNTGAFASPGNAIDTNEATASTSTITSVSGGFLALSSNADSKSIELRISFPDFDLGDFTITSAVLVWETATTMASGLLVTAGSVDVDVQYTLNGSSWNTIQNITATSGTQGSAVDISPGLTMSQLQDLEFRVIGDITSPSGTGTNHTTTFAVRFARLELECTWT